MKTITKSSYLIDLQDKTILIKHVKDIYNECIKYPDSTISSAQSIIKSIKEYISINKLDLKVIFNISFFFHFN
jgi:hypothetical protein